MKQTRPFLFGALVGIPSWATSDGGCVARCRLFPWLGFHFWMSTFTLVHHTGEAPRGTPGSRKQRTRGGAVPLTTQAWNVAIVDVSLLYRVESSQRHFRNTAPQSLDST